MKKNNRNTTAKRKVLGASRSVSALQKNSQPKVCTHPASKLEKIETILTAHKSHPITNTVAQVIFLCRECGELVVRFVEIARPYAANGLLAPEVIKLLEAEQETVKRQAAVAKVTEEMQDLQDSLGEVQTLTAEAAAELQF